MYKAGEASPPAVFGGRQALVEVVHQHRDREGVGAGLVAGACFGGHSLVLLGLLLVLQVLVGALSKDANHLPVHLTHCMQV